MRKKVSVFILSLYKDQNCGDVAINTCARFLINKILKDNNFDNYKLNFLHFTKKEYYYRLREADLIVFAGGGIIRYQHKAFVESIDCITKLADNIGVPVIFSAVGVEGFAEDDDKCKVLKKALNRHCVKMITTRDEFELLIDKFIENKNIIIKKVADSVLWCDEVYKVEKEFNSEVVGIEIIRSNVYKEYGIDFDEDKQLELYEQIINEFDRKNIKWRLFTTGVIADYEFAKKFLEHIGVEDNIIVPQSDYDLVNIISKFKGIISPRLHANIIAYTLGAPFVGLNYNKKLNMFAKNINHEEYFFDVSDYNAQNIVSKLEKAFFEVHDRKFIEEYRDTTYTSLESFIKIFFEQKLYIKERQYCYRNKKKVVF